MSYRISHPTHRYDASDGMHVSPTLLSATTVIGAEVRNMLDEPLGRIQDVMLDISDARIRYAVLSSGGFLGIGDRLFAIPWKALKQDQENTRFMLDVDSKRLRNAPGFNKDEWPDMADDDWNSAVESYYAYSC